MQFRCLIKSFYTLISDPYFVKMHLKKSEQNPHLTVFSYRCPGYEPYLLTFPIYRLHENPSITIHYDPYYRLNDSDRSWRVVGSCNGLLCLLDRNTSPARQWLCLWNPATRTKSEFVLAPRNYSKFFFGYDYLTETYKVIAFRMELDKDIGTATVLMDCLCFSYDFKRTHHFIWQMKDFGVHESWIQLFKINYQNLFSFDGYRMKFGRIRLLPLHLSKSSDTLILENDDANVAIVYNCRDNTSAKIGITNQILWPQARGYVERLALFSIFFSASGLIGISSVLGRHTLAESSVYMRWKSIVDIAFLIHLPLPNSSYLCLFLFKVTNPM
ncbi:transmembrane protein, putative [Medicago truncatula]|uniref:Transmembrane protein, putative n=1 Tax=Medicago truncatula TaxID=3880 RepID=G7JFU0_MEDTR|nr:transmembrane protein, putative [Medicago truncatula]